MGLIAAAPRMLTKCTKKPDFDAISICVTAQVSESVLNAALATYALPRFAEALAFAGAGHPQHPLVKCAVGNLCKITTLCKLTKP